MDSIMRVESTGRKLTMAWCNFSTIEVSVWLPLDGDDGYEIVYVGTEVFTTYTVQATAPVIIVHPSVPFP